MIHENKLVVGNVGDGRIVLCQREHESFRGLSLNEQHRPSSDSDADGSFLAVTRAFGSYWRTDDQDQRVYLKDIGGHSPVGSCGIVCQPDVTSHLLTQNDLFLVIGSDGFFDV